MQVAFNEEIDFLTKFMTVTINVLLFAEFKIVLNQKIFFFICKLNFVQTLSA